MEFRVNFYCVWRRYSFSYKKYVKGILRNDREERLIVGLWTCLSLFVFLTLKFGYPLSYVVPASCYPKSYPISNDGKLVSLEEQISIRILGRSVVRNTHPVRININSVDAADTKLPWFPNSLSHVSALHVASKRERNLWVRSIIVLFSSYGLNKSKADL